MPDKDYKLKPSVYILIHKNGGKYFRLDYRFNGKRKTLGLGVYPETSLKKRGKKEIPPKNRISDGIDPCLTRKIEKTSCIESTFKAIAEDFLMT